MRLALRTRLTVFYTAVFGILLAALAAVSYRVLAQQLDADATASLIELTNGLHGYVRFDDGKPDIVFDTNDPDESAFVQRATRFYQIFDGTSGRLLAQSDAIEPLGLTFTPAEVRSFHDQPRLHDIQTDYGRIRLTNSVLAANGHSYLLQVGTSLATMDAALARFLRLLLWGIPLGLLLAIVSGLWMAGNAVSEMRHFSAALAHELRTPIAALRGEVERLALGHDPPGDVRAIAASQLEELDKLKRLIDQLLTLARAEADEIPVTRGRVELASIALSVAEQLEAVAQSRGVTLDTDVRANPAIEGDRDWIERLLLNLLDNAFKFTPRGGRVTVAVSEANGRARLEVIDTGIGMRADVVPRIFDRFYRGDATHSADAGAGVGLSLVKWIVDRHRGSIRVESTPGSGSRFTVEIKQI